MSPVKRILFFILVLISVVTLPWWLSAVLLLVLTIYLSLYLEVLFFGFLFDAIYFGGTNLFGALSLSFLLLLVVTLIKPYVRFEQF